jgi:HEPN domain-containing protein
MILQDWLKSRWLVEHRASRQEIMDLLSMADRDLAQCRMPNLSPDWQLNIAYNAALQAATAALAAAGYRTAREAHHYRAIQSLAYTVKVDAGMIAQLDKFRKKRNIGSYERAGAVSEQEAKEMSNLAKNLRAEVEKWLRSNHPELL